jgi:hypothetical protein
LCPTIVAIVAPQYADVKKSAYCEFPAAPAAVPAEMTRTLDALGRNNAVMRATDK